MVVVPLNQQEKEIRSVPRTYAAEGTNWARLAASGSLMASALLLLAGKRKAGLVTAAGGTVLALLDQQETVKVWWDSLPGYIDNVQNLLGKVEESVSELESQRARIERVLSR